MAYLDFMPLIKFSHTLPPEYVWCLLVAFCFSSVVLMFRFFGSAGIYAYISLASIVSTIQLLKVVQFSVYSDPVALGTVVFCSMYLCTDMLAEFYGDKAAKAGIWIGLSSSFMTTVFMLITIGFSPLTVEQAGENMQWALPYHQYIEAIFLQVPGLFLAGIVAYLISQFHDVWLYRLLRRATEGRHLWLRNTVSTVISSLIDSIIFSTLAWVVFAKDPVNIEALIFTYILGTYLLRVTVAVLDTPFIYWAKWIGQNKKTEISNVTSI